jgi:hypothetical protein
MGASGWAIATTSVSSRPGFQGGKVLDAGDPRGIFSGQFELGANIMPLWQAYTPAPHE